jgi:spermidine/putrescine transport system ATP-binding protein
VAGFLGVSNLLLGTVAGQDRVRLRDGTEVSVSQRALEGRRGEVAIGIRPEKIRAAAGEANALSGNVAESAYIGVSTQYIVETPSGSVTVYVQNERPGAPGLAVGESVTLSWNPESTFVVDAPEAVHD